MTKIDWTEKTWNPVTGCTKISAGCKNCYAERMATRLQAMGQSKYAFGFEVTCHPEALAIPSRWKKPQMIFVNSMSDIMHRDVPDNFIKYIIDEMKKCYWHTFQVLTKRAGRLINFKWPDNVWVGVSVENKKEKWRMEALSEVKARIKFVSIEPLLEDLDTLNLYDVDWIIVGCESGPKARPCELDWVRGIRDQMNGSALFVKQLMIDGKLTHMPKVDGVVYESYPK